MSNMFEDEARKLPGENTATLERQSQKAPETAGIDPSEVNLQSIKVPSPSADALTYYNGFNDPYEFEDFAAFTATGQKFASTQKRVSFGELLAETADYPVDSTQYPPLDNNAVPNEPYFIAPSPNQAYWGVLGADLEGIQAPAVDGNAPFENLTEQQLWDSLLSAPPVNFFDINQTCQQIRDDVWNARPALDEVQDVPGFSLQPPPLPLHSKPNLDTHKRLQQKHFHSSIPAPTATMVPQLSPLPPSDSEWTPGLPAAQEGEDENVAHTPVQKGRKRKATTKAPKGSALRKKRVSSIAPDDSDSDANANDKAISSLLTPVDKNQKIAEVTTKMAYIQGVVKQVPPGKKLNPRTEAIHLAEEIARTYDLIHPLPVANWSTFRYSATGELNADELLTAADIHTYLYKHPLHTLHPSGIYNPKLGGLRLWIQRNPADSSRRYASPRLNRCKFRDCFATNNVINQGHVRICFDEQTHLGLNNNPFHAAAFVHLNCLERLLDFPAICHDLVIAPENREFPNEPQGRNRMKLAPNTSTALAFAFIRDCENGTLTNYPSRGRPHKGTLAWQLISNKIDAEAPAFKRQRDGRGQRASHIMVHLGDLELEAAVRDKTRRAKYQVDRKGQGSVVRKRKRLSDDGEDESGGGNGSGESEEEEVVVEKKKPKRKYVKRAKV